MTFETQFRNFVGRIKEMDSLTIDKVAHELLEQFNREQEVKFHGWKGKSSLKIWEVGDKTHAEKYKRDDRDEEAKPIVYELNTNDLDRLKAMILSWFKYKRKVNLDANNSEFIKSTELAEEFYGRNWDNQIFNHRKLHNTYTIMLNVIQQRGIIRYSGRGHIYLK